MRQMLKVFLLLCIAFPLMAQPVANKRRGKYLRTEVRGKDAKETFEVKLVQGKGSFPQFIFKKILILTLHEIKLYETVVESVSVNNGEGITPRGTVEYVVVPGEIFEGEKRDRTERHYDGELKMELFTLNNKAYSTDENGIWTDEEQAVLSIFDEMRTRFVTLKFLHKQYGEATLDLSRNLIKRETPVTPGMEGIKPNDILEALGMDFTQMKLCSNDNISVQATCKETAKPGEVIAVTLEMKNKGMRSLSNIIGRTFSSAPGLEGKMFYFGLLLPGQTRSFSRLLTMPQGKGPCYVRIAFWSVSGPMNDNATDLCINVE